MSFTSIPVIANAKNKPECIFSSTEMFLRRNCYQKKTKPFYLQIIRFLRNFTLVTYITDRNGRIKALQALHDAPPLR